MEGLVRRAAKGDAHALLMAQYLRDQLEYVQQLSAAPTEDTATLKAVRQSKNYQVWRLSHAYDNRIAVRTICWFDPVEGKAVILLFAADKASMGDVFYDSVGSRADPIIEQWIKQTRGEKNV